MEFDNIDRGGSSSTSRKGYRGINWKDYFMIAKHYKMVGCSAVGCSNRAEQGYIMKVFPKDPVKRKLWAAKVKRENWTPTNASFLCEVHFLPEQWEKTRAG